MNILFVEDSEIAQRTLRRLVTRMGHALLVADSLAQGYTLAQTSVDLIVLDINLPDGNGLDLARRLRAEQIRTPIIVVTGDPLNYAREDALNAGANDFISKPYENEQMRVLIARYLTASHPQNSQSGS